MNAVEVPAESAGADPHVTIAETGDPGVPLELRGTTVTVVTPATADETRT
jgi:hypothetical protein